MQQQHHHVTTDDSRQPAWVVKLNTHITHLVVYLQLICASLNVQACLLGEEDVQGVLVMCTYLTRLLSKLSSNHTLFSYVPEVRKLPPAAFNAVDCHVPHALHV